MSIRTKLALWYSILLIVIAPKSIFYPDGHPACSDWRLAADDAGLKAAGGCDQDRPSHQLW